MGCESPFFNSTVTRRLRAYLAALLASLLLASGVFAAETPHSINGNPVYYFYDARGEFDWPAFQSSVIETRRFKPLAEAEVPMGGGVHWVFFDLPQRQQATGDSLRLEINFPNIDRVEAVVVSEDGRFTRYVTGDEVAFDRWPVEYRKPSIPLPGLQHSDLRIVLAVHSETPLILPLHLIGEREQLQNQLTEHLLYGLFYGAIFILAIYNAAVYFSLRDKSYQYYVLYILAFALVQASTTGTGQQFIWPALDGATTRIALLAIVLTHFFMVNFVIHFLDLRTHQSALVQPLRWVAYLALLLAPGVMLPNYAYTQFAIHGANILGMAAIMFATFSALPYNPRPALYLIAGYAILFSAIVLALLFQADLIAHYSIVDHSMPIAILVEAIILSVGLSDRIRALRDARETAERDSRIAQEVLTRQLITAREQERAEISRLLHDSVNHDLVVVRNKVLQLAGSSGHNEDDLDAIDALLNKSISEIRNISHMKHPQMVKHLGLQPALEALVENAFDDSVTVNIHIEDIALPYDIQLFFYRAVQESVTNIIKHANATECIVRLYRPDASSTVHFIIRDDGTGFDAKGRNWRFGLRTLNEHCKSLGGELTITSSEKEGTTLSIVFDTEQGAHP
jgi:signal transduction histidine kinase